MIKNIIIATAISMALTTTATAQSASNDLNTAYLHALRCKTAMDYRENVTSTCNTFLVEGQRFLRLHRNTSERLDMNKMLVVLGTSNRLKDYYTSR